MSLSATNERNLQPQNVISSFEVDDSMADTITSRQDTITSDTITSLQEVVVSDSTRSSDNVPSLIPHQTILSEMNSPRHEGATAVTSPPDLPPPYSSFPPYMITIAQNTPGPPPSYEECNAYNSPPPTYESLFGRVREVQKSSNGFVDFGKNLIIFLLGSVGFSLMIGVTIIIPLCMMFIGFLKMSECPVQTLIPIYLVVGGAFGILRCILNLKVFVYRQEDGTIPWHRPVQFTKSINFFLTAWFITGCICVYRVYPPNTTDPSAPDYCDFALYMFAFWLVTSTYIAFGLLTICMCCLSLFTINFLEKSL